MTFRDCNEQSLDDKDDPEIHGVAADKTPVDKYRFRTDRGMTASTGNATGMTTNTGNAAGMTVGTGNAASMTSGTCNDASTTGGGTGATNQTGPTTAAWSPANLTPPLTLWLKCSTISGSSRK